MSGSDMSKNLGGMLSQTAGALGTMGSSYSDSLTRNIENISRPDADPTDIASQQSLMQWQTNMGRTDEAALTFSNIKQQQAMEVIESEKAREARQVEGQARVAKLAQSMQAIAADPNLGEEQRTMILQNLQSAANAEAKRSELDQEEVMGLSNKAITAVQDQQSKAFALKVQQENEQEKQEIKNLTTALSAVDLLNPENQEMMKNSPLAAKYPKVVNDTIKMEQDIAKENKANRQTISTLREPVSMGTLSSMKGAFAPGSAEYQNISAIEKRAADFNERAKDPSATSVTSAEKSRILGDIENATAAYKQPYQQSVAAELQTEKNYETKWKEVASTAITKSEMTQAKARLMDQEMLGSVPLVNNFVAPTPAEIEAEVLRSRRAMVNKAYGKPEDAAPYSSAVPKIGTDSTAKDKTPPPKADKDAAPKYTDGQVREAANGVRWKYSAKTDKWTKVN